MSILNLPEFSSAYFYPVETRCESAIEVDVDDAILRCHYHHPNPDYPTLVHFHGNGEAVASYVTGEFPALVQRKTRGMNTLMIEYRGYGGSTGNAELVSMLSDGENVLKALDIDPAKSIAYGRSIGSLYAIELARRCPTLAGLIIDSGIADARKPFLGQPAVRRQLEVFDMNEIESEFDHWLNQREKISSFTGHLVLFHARNDVVIRVDQAYLLYRAAKLATKELRVYHEGNHNTIFHENHADMLYSLSELAEALFPECKQPLPPSISYAPHHRFEGVDIGCPIEDGEKYLQGMTRRSTRTQPTEQSQQSPQQRPRSNIGKWLEDEVKRREAEAQATPPARTTPPTFGRKILNLFRRK